jgi:hypothetical protein
MGVFVIQESSINSAETGLNVAVNDTLRNCKKINCNYLGLIM